MTRNYSDADAENRKSNIKCKQLILATEIPEEPPSEVHLRTRLKELDLDELSLLNML
jgi:hypothetical protein